MHPTVRRTRLLAVAVATAAAVSACSASGEPSGESASSAISSARDGFEPKRYVALGDSFTAAPFVPDSVEADGCYRSTSNYPSVVARALPGTELVDVSCSAADTTHMTSAQTTQTGRSVPPQLRALTPETDLVTLGIGGNDFNVFGTLITRCPEVAAQDPKGAPCRAALGSGDADPLLSSIDRTQRRVVEVLSQIRRRSPEARILLVNYPQLTPTSGTCAAMPIARGDYRYSLTVAKQLDQALRTAAERADAELVDLWQASKGHDICSDDPWVNGKDADFSRAMSYHPFASGQAAVADLVLEQLGH